MKSFNHNVLCWYPFIENKSILEIYDTFSCLEDNTNIKSVNIDEIDIINDSFDYVVFNSSFSFELYKKIKLNKNGHILLVANNNLSLNKLLCFSFEDSGNGFSKNTIDDIIGKLNYKNYKYYYLNPNVENMFEVFDDDSINKMSSNELIDRINIDKFYLNNINQIDNNLKNNNIAQYFCGAYLVDISDDVIDYNINYVKISNVRNDDYCIYTVLDYKNNLVYKKPLSNLACKHLDKVCKNKWKIEKLENLEYRKCEDGIMCHLLKYKSLKDLYNIDRNKALEIIDDIKNILYKADYCGYQKNDDFIKIFGKKNIETKLHWLNRANVDLIADNIFVDEDKYIVIDSEWFFDFPIPAEFILYRLLKSLVDGLDFNINKYIGIKDFDEEIFKIWERHFYDEYIGNKVVKYKNVLPISSSCIFDSGSEIFALKEKNKLLNVENSRIKNSTVWRLSKPIRFIMDKIKGNL